MYPLPGWLSPITSSIIYLIYAGYLAVKNIRPKDAIDEDRTQAEHIHGPEISPSDSLLFISFRFAAFEDGMEWVNNAAAGGLNDSVDGKSSFMTNALYGDYDKPSDDFQEEDDADLPPGPLELEHEYGVGASDDEPNSIEATNYATRLLDDQDSKEPESSYVSLVKTRPFPAFASKSADESTMQSLADFTNDTAVLTPQDRRSPLKTAIMGMIFVVGIIGVLFANIEIRNLFWTEQKNWHFGFQAAYACAYGFIGFFIKQGVTNFVLRLPRRRALKPIVRLGLDVLFYLYWRSMFFRVSDILTAALMTIGGLVAEGLLYPLRMTQLYFRIVRRLGRAFRLRCLCRRVAPETADEVTANYRWHKRDLAQEYYFVNIAKLFSGVALIAFVSLLRLNWNSDLFEFRQQHMSETTFVHLLAFYAIQLAVEAIFGAFVKYFLFGRIFHVDADFLGDLILTNTGLRFVLVGFMGHFLMDIFVFSNKMTDRL